MAGGWRFRGGGGQVEGGGRLSNEDGDGVFELRPLHGEIGGLDTRGLELRLGLCHIGLRSSPAFEAVHRELQGIGVGLVPPRTGDRAIAAGSWVFPCFLGCARKSAARVWLTGHRLLRVFVDTCQVSPEP
jgi:hypothetical protein